METNERVSINPNKLFTKMEYTKKYDISRPTLDKMILEKKVRVLKVNGTVLIFAD